MISGLRSIRSSRNIPFPIVVSVPHAGLAVPEERKDLKLLAQDIFMGDVDFEVHQIWEDACLDLDITLIKAETHRYAIDLNRRADQIDAGMVKGNQRPVGTEKKGLYWTESTKGQSLGGSQGYGLNLEPAIHESLVNNIWRPYYKAIEDELVRIRNHFGFAILVDAHSMPSTGSAFHADPRGKRSDIVPGDLNGKSCDLRITKACCRLAESLNFSLSLNHPYSGGGITQHFGRPRENFHAMQIELNRTLYMNESSYELKKDGLQRLKEFALRLLRDLASLDLKPRA